MPSNSLRHWQDVYCIKLDEIVEAHRRAVGGTGRGRRYATEQVNHAYAVLLSSQFQGFCRDLHSECTHHIVQQVPAALQNLLHGELVRARKLDRGNANPGNIGADFARLGLGIWDELKALDRRNDARKQLLGELNEWRNAIAHQDFDPSKFGPHPTLRLSNVNCWRRACHQLALAFDSVACTHLEALLGFPPW
jgi:hypothetical protein